MSTRYYDNILSKLESFPSWSPQNESVLLEPYTYITSNPGKEIRGRLIDAFNLWLEVPTSKLAVISRLVSMLHSASLLIDDIEDDSQLRRGQPVAHKIYGVPQTINTANYVFFLAYQELIALRDQDDFESKRGQRLDAIVTVTDGRDYVPLVNLIGVYFQIRDDLMNLLGSEYTKNKGFAEDLTEGKFSFPVVHSIHADKTNHQVLNILQKRPTTPTLKIHTIDYMRTRTKSFEYTLMVLERLEDQTRKEIRRLGGNAKLEGIIDFLSVQPIRDGAYTESLAENIH
ncbi:hypothetical protein C0995_007802 [Termitomyces sp. Mi166|nr:hypothetical protein C0995_007802 [Termitomyces sp. Mi166\